MGYGGAADPPILGQMPVARSLFGEVPRATTGRRRPAGHAAPVFTGGDGHDVGGAGDAAAAGGHAAEEVSADVAAGVDVVALTVADAVGGEDHLAEGFGCAVGDEHLALGNQMDHSPGGLASGEPGGDPALPVGRWH